MMTFLHTQAVVFVQTEQQRASHRDPLLWTDSPVQVQKTQGRGALTVVSNLLRSAIGII
jgi:hypothetical protein